MSQLEKSIKYLNNTLGQPKQYEDIWVIADENRALVDQVDQIWKRKHGRSAHPRVFFDHIVSNQYCGLIRPPCCQSANILSLTRSPADFILFEKNDLELPANQWISRVDCVQLLFRTRVGDYILPQYYSLKICAPPDDYLSIIDSH